MLQIFVNKVDNKEYELINNVESAFLSVKLTGTELERKLIEEIEQGKYNDGESFIDRFGYKIRISELSTGCKAALCVLHFPNKVINLCECGVNARDIVINYCPSGRVLIVSDGIRQPLRR